jgi:HKD family nuclease
MQVQIIDNATRSLASVLPPAIEQSNEVKIAVAFVSRKGLAAIEPAIQTVLAAGGYAEFLVGLDMHTTEPEALTRLYELSLEATNVNVYCYAALSPAAIYHPKLYLIRTGQSVTSIVGSSNLTDGGLRKNYEVNALIVGEVGSEVIAGSYEIFNRLKFHPNGRVPDDDLVLKYSAAFEGESTVQRKAARDSSVRKANADFKEKFKALPRPKPTRRDIAGGWLELVYDNLPDGEFDNEQAYANEQLFRQQYPDNQNIRAKIRQQLQLLRDMQLIEHLGAARWRKL